MKLTKDRLKQIIKEELDEIMLDENPQQPFTSEIADRQLDLINQMKNLTLKFKSGDLDQENYDLQWKKLLAQHDELPSYQQPKPPVAPVQERKKR